MSEFAVYTDRLRGCASQLTGVERQMEEIRTRLQTVQLGSILQIRASSTMIARLRQCTDAVTRQGNDLGKLSDGLTAIATLYDTFERRLSEPSTGENGNTSGTGTVEDASGSWLSGLGFIAGEVTDALLQILGGDNGVFGLLSALFDFGEGEHLNGLQSMFGGLGNIIDSIGTIAGSNGTVNWFDELFGLNASGIDDFGDAWASWLDDMGLGGSSNGASVGAAACRWIGYGLSFVIEGVDNYQDYGGDMGVGFWTETILEGTIDVGLGIGAGVVAAALLPATWPAVVVGAAGGLAVWGLDALCEWATGEDFSDLVLDVGEQLVDGVVDTARNVGRTIADGAEAVCNWFGSLF